EEQQGVTPTQPSEEAAVAEEGLLEFACPPESGDRDGLEVLGKAVRQAVDRRFGFVQTPELHAVDREIREGGGLVQVVLIPLGLEEDLTLEGDRALELAGRRVDAGELLQGEELRLRVGAGVEDRAEELAGAVVAARHAEVLREVDARLVAVGIEPQALLEAGAAGLERLAGLDRVALREELAARIEQRAPPRPLLGRDRALLARERLALVGELPDRAGAR